MFCNHRKEITELKEAISQIKRDQLAEFYKLQNQIIGLRREAIEVTIKQSSKENVGIWHRLSDVKPTPGKTYLVAYNYCGINDAILFYCCHKGFVEKSDSTNNFFRRYIHDHGYHIEEKRIFWKDIEKEVKNLPWNTNDAS